MKKIFAIVLALVSCLCAVNFTACGKDEGGKFTFYAPDGAPALAISKLIANKENFGEAYDFEYKVVSASNIGLSMTKDKGDFIVMPVNAASKLYASSILNGSSIDAADPYKMLSVITHGNLYIMSKGEKTLEDLKGKVVGVIGQGNVPDLTFKAVLKKSEIEYVVGDTATEGKVTLRYFSDASELMPMLKQGKLTIGLLPEPAATKLTKMADDYSVGMDLQELYDPETKTYPQAVLMVKSSVLEKNPKLAKKIENAFEDINHWLYENYIQAIEAVNGALSEGVTPSLSKENIDDEVIRKCNIKWQSAKDAKQEVIDYINAIRAIEEKSANPVIDDFFAD